jgi:putative transposase
MTAQAWRRDWEHITPFLALPRRAAPRRLHDQHDRGDARQIREAVKTRGHFPDEQVATKLVYLAIERAETKRRSARSWTPARTALKIHFGDRLPD